MPAENSVTKTNSARGTIPVQIHRISKTEPLENVLKPFKQNSRCSTCEFIVNSTHAPWILFLHPKSWRNKPSKLFIRKTKSFPTSASNFRRLTIHLTSHWDDVIHVYCSFICIRTLAMCPERGKLELCLGRAIHQWTDSSVNDSLKMNRFVKSKFQDSNLATHFLMRAV